MQTQASSMAATTELTSRVQEVHDRLVLVSRVQEMQDAMYESFMQHNESQSHFRDSMMQDVQNFTKQCIADMKDSFHQEIHSLKASISSTLEGQASKDFIRQELQGLKVLLSSDVYAAQASSRPSFDVNTNVAIEAKRRDSWPPLDAQTRVGMDTEQQENDQELDTIFELVDKSQIWKDSGVDVKTQDEHNEYFHAMDAKRKTSFWHQLFAQYGMSHYLTESGPDNVLCRIVDHALFSVFQSFIILLNTTIMAYEADLEIKAELQVPKENLSEHWLRTWNRVFNIIFTVEVLFRFVAKRTWFLVEPVEWAWNMFDVSLVTVCIFFEFLSDTNLGFIRTVRILRVFRAARIIRVMRFFRELRTILYSIMACLASLAWAFVFLAASISVFSLVCIQGAANALQEEDSLGEVVILYGGALMRNEIEYWYGSFGTTMFSLLVATTGGADWLTVMEPLNFAGPIYSITFVVYTLFVIVGVMNVLTGVFLSSASEFIDVDLIAQNELVKVDQYIEQVTDMFMSMDEDNKGKLTWAAFQAALERPNVRAYLGSMGLSPTHIRLIFDLLDLDESGEVSIEEFVMGMARLKGEAKAIDARIILREVTTLPSIMKKLLDGYGFRPVKSAK